MGGHDETRRSREGCAGGLLVPTPHPANQAQQLPAPPPPEPARPLLLPQQRGRMPSSLPTPARRLGAEGVLDFWASSVLVPSKASPC